MTTTLVLDDAGGAPLVRSVRDDAVVVGDREFPSSFALWAEGVIEDWPVASAAAIEAAHLDTLVATGVDVILLGTGRTRVQLAAALMARPLTRGVGLEVMANDAAARTYNVLASEGRRVLVAFILPAG
ncbi:Mth938-like domain-containing protein [Pseudofulvimonas gallinarii]|jgi:uncharacterized protein|uniref:Mth938-like domain-containing protein n=1 Tax=Pseudofulvimonas gallinarii TaxID=634155 RepID=A0A4S3KWA8_9GAMM|nr:MTH938/NDUFAF3 family protein [Pseudofulvimonas gallinarii]TCT00084.1 uncharacterized protein EDC25_10474 [Pseudofulvimonas gallinarii]THD13557.1 hypothetical protein B1808_07380 [Pseudofulvimonas gallinarii]